ncbi:cation/H(+) symporter 13-like [Silene latifolia]|uniref:cation/H(+) symporter 13-like n=1 Tax=Silene latifolia TaxID=37657 RepID=UPI003D77BDEF
MGDRASIAWNEGNTTEGISIACQGFVMHSNVFGGIIRKISSSLLFDVGIFLILYRFVRTLLKPLRMPFASQLLAGFIVGPFFGIYVNNYAINRPSLFLISSVLANIGFFLQLFVLGLSINLGKLTKTGKKAFILSYSGLFTSLAFSFATYVTINTTDQDFRPTGIPAIIAFNASNYLLSTSSHLNDLGMSNSKLGRLASSTSMVTDMSVMLISITILNVILPILGGTKTASKSLVVLYYALLFSVFRPLIIYLVSFKKEGISLKRTHFVMIIVLILVIVLLGESFDQRYSPFLVALTLPEEPLLTILTERLDPFTSNILFPFFVINCGMHMTIPDLRSYGVVIILVMGYIGKFLGVIIPACFLRLPFSQATSLALVMSTRGIMDISPILSLFHTKGLSPNHYTIVMLHASITMGVLLPLVRLLYEPSRQYSTIMRRGVIDFQENSEVLLILVCIHKEESLPGLVRFLKAFYSTQQNPVSILALDYCN